MAVVICYLVCALVWSTTWFAIRVCIGAGGYPTYAAVAIRFTVAALVLIAISRFRFAGPRPRTRRHFLALGTAGLFLAIGYACVYRSEEDLPGGLVAVLFGTMPLFTALAAAATGIERVRRVDVAAALLALVGMAILFWDRLSISTDQAAGIAFAIGGVLATVVYGILMKREANALNPLSASGVFFAVAAAALWIPAAAETAPLPSPLPLAPTLALLYLVVFGTVITFACYFYLLKRVTLMTAATLVLVEPVIALVVDALWEHDVRLVARSYIGVAITLAAVSTGITWKWWSGRRAA